MDFRLVRAALANLKVEVKKVIVPVFGIRLFRATLQAKGNANGEADGENSGDGLTTFEVLGGYRAPTGTVLNIWFKIQGSSSRGLVGGHGVPTLTVVNIGFEGQGLITMGLRRRLRRTDPRSCEDLV